MPNIPEDVVLDILDSYPNWWSRDLSRFALVSSTWLNPARSHLFARPFLSSYRACFLLYRTLHNNSHLASLVRGLDLRPDRNDCDLVHHRYMESVPMLLALPTLQLQELALGEHLSCQAERFLRAVGNPQTISSLRITGSTDDFCGESSLEWDSWELSTRFSGMKKLELLGPMHLEIYCDQILRRPSNNLFGCRIEELRVVGTSGNAGLLGHLFGIASWSTLRTLVLVADSDGFEDHLQLTSLLRTPLPSLESLSIEYRKQYSPYRTYPLFDMDLEDLLELGHYPGDDESPQSFIDDVYTLTRPQESVQKLCVTSLCLTADALPAIAQLFPNMRCFDVRERCDNLISLGEWARFHQGGRLQRLTHFSLSIDRPKGRRGPPDGLDLLKNACSTSKINLNYSDPSYHL